MKPMSKRLVLKAMGKGASSSCVTAEDMTSTPALAVSTVLSSRSPTPSVLASLTTSRDPQPVSRKDGSNHHIHRAGQEGRPILGSSSLSLTAPPKSYGS